MKKNDDFDILIIGAGPAGSVAASNLCRYGYRVLIIEKTIFPRFMIGESLLPQCMDILQESELLDSVHQQNFQKKNGAIFFRGNESQVFEFAEQHTKGWNYTYQVPRAHFDQVLAEGAVKKGAKIYYNHSVVAVDFSSQNPKITIEAPDGTQSMINSRFVLDASGSGGVLPRLLKLDAPTDFPVRESLFSHVSGFRRDGIIDTEKIWVCIHPEDDQVWLWIIPFSNDIVSCGIVGKPDFFENLPQDKEEQMRLILGAEKNLQTRIDDIQFNFPPKSVRAYARNVTTTFGDNFALLGNSAGFLDPVFSSGVTIALKSASLASKILHRQFSGDQVNWKIEFEDKLRNGIDTFKTYVNAWYDGSFQKIIFLGNKPQDIKSKICSILAGYVWDKTNPYVEHHERRLQVLSKLCEFSN